MTKFVDPTPEIPMVQRWANVREAEEYLNHMGLRPDTDEDDWNVWLWDGQPGVVVQIVGITVEGEVETRNLTALAERGQLTTWDSEVLAFYE